MDRSAQRRLSPGSVKGRALRPGDCVGIVAPSGAVVPRALERGLQRLHAWGFKTLLGDHVLERRGYLAGDDAGRAADFNAIWSNPDVAGVICAGGGVGSMRILPAIDWAMVRRSPKFFCGFSDITALHLALEAEAGLITFHGPMAAAFGGAKEYNAAELKRALTTREPLGEIPWPAAAAPDSEASPSDEEEGASNTSGSVDTGPVLPTPVTITAGIAEGRLGGGNLSLLCGLMGTPWEPDFTGRLLLLEDTNEPPYRMDRMLHQLLLGGTLQRAAGILIGDSPSCVSGPAGRASLSLWEVLKDVFTPLGIPVLYGFPCGHEAHRATLPLGAHTRLDAGGAVLTILEPALV